MKKLLHFLQIGLKPLFCLFFLFASIGLSAQQVSGTIQDKEGTPIVGASVLVKGTI
jgi:hypothetical protein